MRRAEKAACHADPFRCARFGKKSNRSSPILLSRPFQPPFWADLRRLVHCWDRDGITAILAGAPCGRGRGKIEPSTR